MSQATGVPRLFTRRSRVAVGTTSTPALQGTTDTVRLAARHPLGRIGAGGPNSGRNRRHRRQRKQGGVDLSSVLVMAFSYDCGGTEPVRNNAPRVLLSCPNQASHWSDEIALPASGATPPPSRTRIRRGGFLTDEVPCDFRATSTRPNDGPNPHRRRYPNPCGGLRQDEQQANSLQ